MKINSTSIFAKQESIAFLFVFLFPLLVHAAYLPIAYTNMAYESNIKTAIMTQNGSYERFPAIDLNSNQQLNLQFDDMMPESDNYQFTFIHCSSDWKVSNLKPNEYLTGAMFENITNYTFSTTTFQVYTHYNVNFPSADMKPKLSGNYILKIFRNFDENDLILTHRFIHKVIHNLWGNLQQLSVMSDSCRPIRGDNPGAWGEDRTIASILSYDK